MKLKIYKPAFFAAALLLAQSAVGLAQNISVSVKANPVISVNTNFDSKDFEVKMDNFAKNLETNLKDITKNISVRLNNITSNVSVGADNINVDPKIDLKLGNLFDNLNINVSGDDENDEAGENSSVIKEKNYSKSYSLDGNDRIKLSNQYGKITVNTWNNREIKVDIQITAEAGNDEDAQRLINGVQIADGKNDNEVFFRTHIENNNDNGWNVFKWGNNSKKHKLTINYMVYMPAKTDLNVEESYGSIALPDMEGRVRVSTSYGSTSIQSLSNPSNTIEGSYGSMKIGSMNGGKLDFSYGSVDMDECNNLKADLSYGSFKLGKLKGTGDFDMSYEGGFRIGELAGSLKRLNISNSYSGVALGVTPASNFDFDITTSYGGFDYNDNNVFITAKNPPDGSRHIGTTRSYKGHVGKSGTEAKVTINASYGGVKFE